ncbi:Molybdopterin biosynthesis protein MoeA [Paramagnetospirillum magnetotacticum MS-1]|uniref:Molybdopterin molybdenumtransferase n=1 Tax=Paramagnetospirillum magnetotacticum MS-1 TaxID=272627 RepID=A0A0C2UCZ7_PARME|nr:gephyrin-like molybdotransferase Glp [Paramagnetospirillum magnetotacticum]KIL99382.1 Molybdopterin biosynthesis protein MoeA [Paramagnetospirillum magnetotacticum MS-1]
MISVEVARETLLTGIKPVGTEVISLSQATGRILAEDLTARVSHPPVAVSAMDGYAVRAEDLAQVPHTLQMIGQSAAGAAFTGTVGPGQCIRIFTGAPVPKGADAVIMQENTRRDAERIEILTSAPAGRHVRPAGLDFAAGDMLIPAGTVMGGRTVGLAAAMNIPNLLVRRKPRIAILSTGDEIVLPGDQPGPSQIVGSNGPGLAAMVTALGAEAIHLGIAKDTRDSLDTMIKAAAGADMLVTTGGASVGDYDLVQDALKSAGMNLGFYQVAMRPGKPLMFGDMKGIPVLGLPGNPVSSMVCAIIFLEPAIRALTGRSTVTQAINALLGRDLPPNDARMEFMRGTLERTDDGLVVALPFEQQDSAVISGLARATCLVVRPPHAPTAQMGDMVQVIPLPAVL